MKRSVESIPAPPTVLITPDWPLPDHIGAVITTRIPFKTVPTAAPSGVNSHAYQGNNLALHVGDDPVQVKCNRRRLLAALPDVRAIQWLNQIHSNWVVRAAGGAVVPMADGALTTEAGLACAVLTADCLPILIAAQDGSQVAALHAGWRGLAAGIIANACAVFDTPVSVFLGPAIGPQQFEVGPEVRAAFHWASEAAFKPGNGDRLLANLYQLAREQLQHLGVTEIYGGDYCTLSDADTFYSYRRETVTGRMASLIWIAK